MTPDENLTGLAKAKQRALEAKKRESPGPSLEDSPSKQLPIPILVKSDSRQVVDKFTFPTNTTPLGHPSSASSSPPKLRRKLSKRLKDSQSLESLSELKSSAPQSPESLMQPIITPPLTSVSMSSSQGVGEMSPETTKSTHQLHPSVELKSSKHIRESPSISSINSDFLGTGECSDDNKETSRKKRYTRTNSLKLPKGVTPDQAARILPSSVKTALGTHARSESMGYLVLLPHEVVQLNDVAL
jgi:hypothetical protein